MTHRLALFIHRVTQVHLAVQVDKVIISCEPEHLNRKSALRGLAVLHHLNGCIQCVWTSEWEHTVGLIKPRLWSSTSWA